MRLMQAISEDPLSVFAGCFVWILVAAWILTAIGWMVSGEIDGLTGMIVLGIALGLGAVSTVPPVPGLGVWTFLAAVVTTVMFPFVRQAVNRRAMVQIDLEQIERLCETLKHHPDSASTLWRLAQLCRQVGLEGQALRLGEAALASMPKKLFANEHREFSSWQAAVRPGWLVASPCLRCGTHLKPGTVWCPSCGSPHLVDSARGRWLGTGLAGKLIALWGVGVIALVGLPLAANLSPVSAPLSIGLTVGLIGAGAVIVLHLLTRLGGAG